MIKFFIALFFTFLCTYLGYKFSIKYVLRRKFYTSLASFNVIFKEEVAFGKKTIPAIIKENKFDSDFNNFLLDYERSINTGEELSLCVNYITDVEKSAIFSYFNKIGKSDAESQLKLIDTYKTKFTDLVKKCEEEEKKYRTLYIKLGFLIGLIAFILVI